MADVVALVDDVFFQAKLVATACQGGVKLSVVSSKDFFLTQAVQPEVTLLIVDLNARASAIEALECLRDSGNQRPVIAFFSHVQTELADRARSAGCRQVMPRSKFTRNLAAILASAKAPAGDRS